MEDEEHLHTLFYAALNAPSNLFNLSISKSMLDIIRDETDEQEGFDNEERRMGVAFLMGIKQNILNELVNSERRSERSVQLWQQKNFERPEDMDRKIANGAFPTGFGFYLMDAKNRAPEMEPEVELNQLADLIMALPDTEVQDRLLSFLDDFVAKKRVLEQIKHDRSELLNDIQEWMNDDQVELSKVQSTHVSVAVDIENEVRDAYQKTFANMERLLKIKKQMLAEKEKGLKTPPKKEELPMIDLEQSWDGDDNDPILSSVMAGELLKFIQDTKDDYNEEELEPIEVKIKEFIAKMKIIHEETERAKSNLEQKEEERQVLVEMQTSLKKEIETLRATIKEMEHPSKPDQPKKKNPMVKLPEKKTAETQTSPPPVEEPKPQPKPIPRLSQITLVKGKPSAEEVSEMTDSGTLNAIEVPPLARKKSVAAGAKKPPTGKNPSVRQEAAVLRSPSSFTPEERFKKMSEVRDYVFAQEKSLFSEQVLQDYETMKKARQSVAKPASSAHAIDAEKAERRGSVIPPTESPSMPTTPGPAETPEALRAIMTSFIEGAVQRTKDLLKALLTLRKNARDEIGKMKDKESFVEHLEELLEWIMEVVHVHSLNLPMFETTEETVKLCCRKPMEHDCHFCLCHDSVAETVDLACSTNPSKPESISEILEHSKRYLSCLEKIHSTYSEVTKIVTNAQQSIRSFISGNSQRDAENSESSDLMEEIDTEMMDIVTETLDIPESLEDMVVHVKYMASTIDSLTQEIVTALESTNKRLAKIKTQNESLEELEGFIKKARYQFDLTALHVARTRANQNYVVTSRALKGCVCPFCSCFNSPFEDGTRLSTGDNPLDIKKLELRQNIARLQQIMSMVVANTGSLEQPMVSGVLPDVIDIIDSAQRKLYVVIEMIYDAADVDDNIDEEKQDAEPKTD